jgi:hypothetical protein
MNMSDHNEGKQYLRPSENVLPDLHEPQSEPEATAGVPAPSRPEQRPVAAGEAEDAIADFTQEHGEDSTAAEEEALLPDGSPEISAAALATQSSSGVSATAPESPRRDSRGRAPSVTEARAEEAGESSDAILDAGQSGFDDSAAHAGESSFQQ